jgi:hypothetical protein
MQFGEKEPLNLPSPALTLIVIKGASMPSPVKITRDDRIIAPPDAPPLTGLQMLELGKKLLARGCVAIALEAVDGRSTRARAAALDTVREAEGN